MCGKFAFRVGPATINLPPSCPTEGFNGHLQVVDGLPEGSTLEMNAQIISFASTQSIGGTLGGTIETFTATILLDVVGTGPLAGFQRALTLPVNGELHVAPLTPGQPVQSFDVTMYRLRGKLQFDFDFWLLEFEGGDGHVIQIDGRDIEE